jgi:isoleucyl-tRNA synthetase
VHLSDIPVANKDLVDSDLEYRMGLVRRASMLGRSLRAKHQIKTRQVLPSMLVITRKASDGAAIERGAEMLRNELNVKDVHFTTDEAQYVALTLKPNLKTLGPRLGKDLGLLKKHLESLVGKPEGIVALLQDLEERGTVNVLGYELTEGDFMIERGPKDHRLIATEKGVTVLLDTTLTEDLIQEGLAREVVNRIQKLRKESGLEISDRIVLEVAAKDQLKAAIEGYQDYIGRETLGTTLTCKERSEHKGSFGAEFEIEGTSCYISLSVVTSAQH